MPKNPFRKTETKPVEPEPVEAPAAIVGALPDMKPKNPLDCPECDLPINHAGPHV